MRVLAVDWGEKRVGLAVSDPAGIIATGLETLQVTGPADAVRQVAKRAREIEAGHVVVGMPFLMSGARGSAADAAQAFADALGAALTIPVETYDERLTSALSARRLREVGVKTGHERGRIDQGAAVALLESFLSRLESRRRNAT